MKNFETTINKIRSTILKYEMISPGDKVIVALSGGPDSICLLNALHKLSPELEISLVVAHIDHGLRGAEDEFETQLARKVAGTMGLPFETEKVSCLKDIQSSLEERARSIRYSFLERICKIHKAQKIALGHNLNDQAETILMRLLRGSGPSGLSGIPPIRDKRIIRPLIEVQRDEILYYLNAHSIPFAIDSSNTNIKHLRNRIRLELVPILLDYQPNLMEQLGKFSNIIRDEDILLESITLDWIDEEAERKSTGNVSVLVSSIRTLSNPLRNRVIRALLKEIKGDLYPMEYNHIASVSKLLDNEQPQCSIDLPNGITASKVYNRLQFSQGKQKKIKGYSYSVRVPGTFFIYEAGQTIQLEEAHEGVDLPKGRALSMAYLDADKLRYPLVIRNFRHGDRFIPLGMTGHKKLKNFFIDLKIPSDKRGSIPLLTSGDNVAWICGYRIDERFKITSQTKKIVRVTINQV